MSATSTPATRRPCHPHQAGPRFAGGPGGSRRAQARPLLSRPAPAPQDRVRSPGCEKRLRLPDLIRTDAIPRQAALTTSVSFSGLRHSVE